MQRCALHRVRDTNCAQLKPRRALLGEGLDAFLDLVAAHAVAVPLVGRRLIKLAARDLVDGALHAAHRDRRVTGQDAGEPVDLFVQRFDWHHRGEIADPQHFRRADFFGGEKQSLGIVEPEACHVTRDAAFIIVQAESGGRHEHFAGVDADAEIAGQRQIGRAAIDPAIEPADGGNADVFEPVDDRLEGRARAFLFDVAGGALGHGIEVVAGAESAAGAGEHQNANRGIGFDLRKQLPQHVEIVGLQSIEMPRPVQANGGACALAFQQRRACVGFRHFLSPLFSLCAEHDLRANVFAFVARENRYPLFRIMLYLFSSARRWASASMVSAISGWRAIRSRKSTRSSTRSCDTRVVVMLAERRLLPSSAISPKKAPSPRATFLPGKSTSTSPLAMKYMQSPAWPLRMMVVRAGRSMVRNICVTSAIAAGPSEAKNGTLLTDSQVRKKLSRRVSAAKPVERIPVPRPNTPRPQIMTPAAMMRPSGVIGTTSP